MQRKFICLLLFLFIFEVGMNEAKGLEAGDIVYRTSDNGFMYGLNSTSLNRPGHTGIYVGDTNNDGKHWVVEALGWWLVAGVIEKNLLSEFVDSSKGNIYRGGKTTTNEPSNEQRENIVYIALDQVGEGYDNNFSNQKGPDDDDWTCVGLVEKAYESADTPEELQYGSSYGAGDENYALDITPDGVDNNNSFSTSLEMSELIWFKNIFFPQTQWLQNTLKDVGTDLPVSDNFHFLTPPSSTTVSQSSLLGPFYASATNNTSSSYSFYVYPYLGTPDGNWILMFTNLITLAAGETGWANNGNGVYIWVPYFAQTGTTYHCVNIYDTSYNLIDQDCFSFEVTAGSSSVQSSKDQQKLRILSNTPGTKVHEKDGWEMIIMPEKRANNRWPKNP